jgi:hypothetical protein
VGQAKREALMRRIDISFILGKIKDPAAAEGLKEVELASAEYNLVDIVAPFVITGTYTETRTLNVGVSTLAQTQAFIATLIEDIRRGGESRST